MVSGSAASRSCDAVSPGEPHSRTSAVEGCCRGSVSCGFTELQELLGDDCGVSTSGKNPICFWCRRDCRALASNLLDSGHVPCEVGYGSLLGSQSFAFCLKKKSLTRSFPPRSVVLAGVLEG